MHKINVFYVILLDPDKHQTQNKLKSGKSVPTSYVENITSGERKAVKEQRKEIGSSQLKNVQTANSIQIKVYLTSKFKYPKPHKRITLYHWRTSYKTFLSKSYMLTWQQKKHYFDL